MFVAHAHLKWHVSHFSVVLNPSNVLGGGCMVHMRQNEEANRNVHCDRIQAAGVYRKYIL